MIAGALQHKDSMGNGSVIRPGELQRMTAGTGVLHSEFNHSPDQQAHLLQIWILPEENGLEPGYEQKLFPLEEKRNRWRVVGSRDGRDGSLTIHQDIILSSTVLDKDAETDYVFEEGRRGYLQVVSGNIQIEDKQISAGDAMAVEGQSSISILAKEETELLLFDMA